MGIALLISIFILMLISVVAIALIVSSGTESALTGNYRSSTAVYYAALAGVEEARSRLQAGDPNAFRNLKPGTFLPPPGTDLPACTPVYIVNPAQGEVVTPWDSSNAYYDTQYNQEFNALCPAPLPPNPSPSTPSVWNINPQPFPAPVYKWVRINAITEQLLQLDVAPYDGTSSENKLIYYDSARLTDTQITGSQVLEITALAVLPNGSQKLLQYLVAPQPIALPPFLATLSLLDGPGNSISFHAPASNASYAIKGDNDQDCSGNPLPAKIAIGVFNNPDQNVVLSPSGIPTAYQPNYTGVIKPGPDVERIDAAFPANFQDPAQLNALAKTIIQSADAVVPQGSNATQIAYLSSLNMSPTNVLTVVANGDLDISNWSSDGYGLLLVTGTFTYDPDTNWNGVILVIGQGKVTGSHQQFKQINGAMLVAKTLDDAGTQLATLGGASVVFDDNMQGNGMRYSSCWIQRAEPKSGYKILSFHEISQ